MHVPGCQPRDKTGRGKAEFGRSDAGAMTER